VTLRQTIMTRFILVRHGQTEWNRDERFRGRVDLPLNETGVRQAEAAGSSLKGRPVSAVYSSPLRRALETATIIAKEFNLPVSPLDGLIDIDFGNWQGLSAEEAAEQDGRLYEMWLQSPHEVRFPGGEGLDEVRERVLNAVDAVAAQHRDETVLLVSHMVVCRVLMCAMLGLDNSRFWQVRQDVCAVNAFQGVPGASVVTLVNDTCHLKGLATR
jgi:broad specificity phosphatase PhoE